MLPTKSRPTPRTRRVAVVAYEGVSLLDLSGPLEVFVVATRFVPQPNGVAPYECSVVSASGGPIRSADGVTLVTKSVRAFENKAIDTLIIPGACDIEDVTRDQPLINWVRKQAPSCRRICSVCIGSFILAAAGVLDRRRATTHWRFCKLLSKRYPTVTVEPDAIFVRDDQVWTSAGVTTGIDLSMALIEEDLGHQAAMTVARMLVVYLKRAGGQSQYSALLEAQTEFNDDVLGSLEVWMAEHLTEDLSVHALAERAHMSPRNFARVYAQTRGRTPAKSVEAIRVETARRLLEETESRMKSIAQRCGFSNEEQMRCAFIRSIGIPPREYRERFSAPRMKGNGGSPKKQNGGIVRKSTGAWEGNSAITR